MNLIVIPCSHYPSNHLINFLMQSQVITANLSPPSKSVFCTVFQFIQMQATYKRVTKCSEGMLHKNKTG
ncbi:hypothetical protein HanPSC8_Chr08g0321581 [Helianthus annuus]|nr:hypothetical protein HanPSC8_Chr08g0321581 [Helianthus annuus]